MLCADNGKLDAEVTATTEHGTDDDVTDRVADKKSDSAGRPARPQPPVSVTFHIV